MTPGELAQPQMFWNLLVEVRVHIYYASALQAKAFHWNRYLSIFLAIVSSAGIAGWGFWSNYQGVWAFLVGCGQLAFVIRPFLPFERRADRLYRIVQEYEDLALYCEDRWFDIAKGKLTEDDIHQLVMEVRRRLRRAFNANSDPTPIHDDYTAMEIAKKKAKQYFKVNYGV